MWEALASCKQPNLRAITNRRTWAHQTAPTSILQSQATISLRRRCSDLSMHSTEPVSVSSTHAAEEREMK